MHHVVAWWVGGSERVFAAKGEGERSHGLFVWSVRVEGGLVTRVEGGLVTPRATDLDGSAAEKSFAGHLATGARAAVHNAA